VKALCLGVTIYKEEASRDTPEVGNLSISSSPTPHVFPTQPSRLWVHDTAADELGRRCSGAGLGRWP
jgi:hypothetical protein